MSELPAATARQDKRPRQPQAADPVDKVQGAGRTEVPRPRAARDHPYADRAEAGRELASALAGRHWAQPVVVLALPRGGVPVAAEVARALAAPLDLLIVRKIGAPGQPELAVAAVACLGEGAVPQFVTDERLMRCTGADQDWVDRAGQHELDEIARRRRRYLGGRAPLELKDRTALIVDDGLATGTTARAAVLALRHAPTPPARIVLAVPVAPPEAVQALTAEVDELLCLWQPPWFHAVGAHYRDFRQVDDDEVVKLLAAFRGG